MGTALIILAAGKGTRMNSDLPKVLHLIAQTPMLAHTMATGAALNPERTVIVAGFGADRVRTVAKNIDKTARIVLQEEQLGTAHAVDQARTALTDFDGDAIVLFGDTPFVSAETLQRMIAARRMADVVILGFRAADPARYGRLVVKNGNLERIVEYRDATEEERAITLCNSGLLACDTRLMFNLIREIGNDNAAGEYYLTDIIGLARARGLRAAVVECPESETLGINSQAELARANAIFQSRERAALLNMGVTLMAPETVYLAKDTVIGRDTVIEPHVVFGPGVTIETGVHIRAFSYLEGCYVSRGAVVGPYARLRPGTELAENTRIGNFVEIKNTTVGKDTKVNHLSYVGDASIGAATNIGAGTITCNYDGVCKHRTMIGTRAFIGSNTMLVAPVSVGNEAMTAAGSVITSDVKSGTLAISRVKQEVKPGRAHKLMDMPKEPKEKQP